MGFTCEYVVNQPSFIVVVVVAVASFEVCVREEGGGVGSSLHGVIYDL